MAGRVVWGYLADRRVAPPLMLGALAVTGAVAGLIAATIDAGTGSLQLMCLFAVYGAVAIGWNGVFLATVAREAPAGYAGMATGGALAVTFFGAVIGAPAFAMVAQWSGSYGIGFAVFSTLAALCGMALAGKRKAFVR